MCQPNRIAKIKASSNCSNKKSFITNLVVQPSHGYSEIVVIKQAHKYLLLMVKLNRSSRIKSYRFANRRDAGHRLLLWKLTVVIM